MYKIICLEVTSFRGISLGAIHWYGTLRHPRKDLQIRLDWPMSEEEAKEQNRRDRHDSYSAGDMTERFSSKEHLVQRALEVCMAFNNEEELLLIEGRDDINPHKVLACPDPVDHNKLNRLHAAAEALGWYGNHWDKWNYTAMDGICADYEEILKGYQ